MVSNDALARFLTQMAAAAQELAAELQGSRYGSQEPNAAVVEALGRRQREAYQALLGNGADLGTGEIAARIGYDFSNTYMTLRRLEQLSLVELVPGVKPQRWRLRQTPAEHRQ